MKHSMLLMHPTIKNQLNPKSINIFEQARKSQSLPSIHKPLNSSRQQRLYDFVGSKEFKLTKIFKEDPTNNTDMTKKLKQLNLKKELQESQSNFNKLANMTINRQTILSKLSKNQHLQATKDKRNIERYRQYKEYWQNQAQKVKQSIHKKRPSVLSASENIIIEQNPSKIDIINNNMTRYWQMSLRNNNPILLRHIKGHKYNEIELEMKLQANNGTIQVEKSIPRLPIENLKKLKKRDISLTGKSKSQSESQSQTERSNYTRSILNSNFSNQLVQNQEEIYKISYQGDKKWLGQEGFMS